MPQQRAESAETTRVDGSSHWNRHADSEHAVDVEGRGCHVSLPISVSSSVAVRVSTWLSPTALTRSALSDASCGSSSNRAGDRKQSPLAPQAQVDWLSNSDDDSPLTTSVALLFKRSGARKTIIEWKRQSDGLVDDDAGAEKLLQKAQRSRCITHLEGVALGSLTSLSRLLCCL
jgi:hypothetical protein